MLISNREQLSREIVKLNKAACLEKDKLRHQMETMQQSADPVFLLRQRLAKNKNQVPHLFDNLIDESFFSGADLIKNKIGLNEGSFVTRVADNLLQKKINHFFACNRHKIKSFTLAVAKNIFR